MRAKPVTSETWKLMSVFLEAVQFQVCKLFPIWMWSSGRERSAWGEHWRKLKEVIVGLKKQVKEISLYSMGSLDKEAGGESEGFTFADNLQRADLLSETVLEGVVDTPDLPLC